MAVIKTLQRHGGRTYCLVLDARADTAEVVAEEGFDVLADDEIEFRPSYYQPAGGVMLRMDATTDQAVGAMAEHVSKWVRPIWLRRSDSTLEVIDYLFERVHGMRSERVRATDQLFETV